MIGVNGVNQKREINSMTKDKNSLLYITTKREKYFRMTEKFISQLQIYVNVITVLSKGYLPISLMCPMKLHEILKEVKKPLACSYKKVTFVL